MRDTRTVLREKMDKLCEKLVTETNKLKGDGNANEYRATIDTVTKYLSMANREPGEREGGDFDRFRSQLAGNGAGGGSDTGGPEGGPDAKPETGSSDGEASDREINGDDDNPADGVAEAPTPARNAA